VSGLEKRANGLVATRLAIPEILIVIVESASASGEIAHLTAFA